MEAGNTAKGEARFRKLCDFFLQNDPEERGTDPPVLGAAALAPIGGSVTRPNGIKIGKSYLLLLTNRVYCPLNRVGDRASSATGTGSLPGGRRTNVHDEVTAPAVAYGIPSFM